MVLELLDGIGGPVEGELMVLSEEDGGRRRESNTRPHSKHFPK